uniref:Uncharacterized protein n=1 Tax=Oryza nivara TaxID=4536 RepID=A0A679BAB7_ORYNI|nr:hypothetical protein [Oryza sativa f. spontanea]
MEEQRSSVVGIPCEKVTRVRILGGQLRSTVGIGTRLREELRSRRSRIPDDEVKYEMAYGGWTPCGRDVRNGLHEVACMCAWCMHVCDLTGRSSSGSVGWQAESVQAGRRPSPSRLTRGVAGLQESDMVTAGFSMAVRVLVNCKRFGN